MRHDATRPTAQLLHQLSKSPRNDQWKYYKFCTSIKHWHYHLRRAVYRRLQGSSRTGTPFPLFFIQRERRSCCFFLYTPIVNCYREIDGSIYVYVYYVHSISCMCVWLADSEICVYVYDIMDDTSAMWDNWPVGSWHIKLLFDSCFIRLILTLKQAPRMHQNTPLPDKKSKKMSGEGARPPPQRV